MSLEMDILVKEIEKLQDKLNKAFKKYLESFLKSNPGIQAIGWLQYTPYFNDGEACVFGVHDLYYTKEEGGCNNTDFYNEEDGWSYYRSSQTELTKEEEINLQSLENYLGECEDRCKDLFGDHVKVIITKEGIQVDEYEHD